jgi:ribonuclease P/MRP protein subunit POP8
MMATHPTEENSAQTLEIKGKSGVEAEADAKEDAEVPSVPSKRKRDHQGDGTHGTATGGDGTISFTTRNPPWAYFQLELCAPPSQIVTIPFAPGTSSFKKMLSNFLLNDRTTQPTPSSALQASSIADPLDAITARTYLTSALSQFLGLTGTAIPIDILKIETSSPSTPDAKNILWIRVPRDDAAAVAAAVSSWIGGTRAGGGVAWRIRAKGSWLAALVAGSGSELFAP